MRLLDLEMPVDWPAVRQPAVDRITPPFAPGACHDAGHQALNGTPRARALAAGGGALVAPWAVGGLQEPWRPGHVWTAFVGHVAPMLAGYVAGDWLSEVSFDFGHLEKAEGLDVPDDRRSLPKCMLSKEDMPCRPCPK
jgi:hypothetical protein